MVCQRTVASFAGHACMFTVALCFRYVGVAGFAGGMPRESDWAGTDFIHCRGAKMPVLAEIPGITSDRITRNAATPIARITTTRMRCSVLRRKSFMHSRCAIVKPNALTAP